MAAESYKHHPPQKDRAGQVRARILRATSRIGRQSVADPNGRCPPSSVCKICGPQAQDTHRQLFAHCSKPPSPKKSESQHPISSLKDAVISNTAPKSPTHAYILDDHTYEAQRHPIPSMCIRPCSTPRHVAKKSDHIASARHPSNAKGK